MVDPCQCDIIGTITCFLHETLVRSFQLPVKYIWSTRKLFSWIVYSCSTFCFFTKILCWCVGSNVSNISSESNIWVVGLPVRIVHHYYLNSKAEAWEKLCFWGDKQLRSWETPSFIGGCCQVAQPSCRIDGFCRIAIVSAESLPILRNRFCRIAPQVFWDRLCHTAQNTRKFLVVRRPCGKFSMFGGWVC